MILIRWTILLIVLFDAVLPWPASWPENRTQPKTEENIEIGRLDPANPTGIVVVTDAAAHPGSGIFGIRVLAYRPGEQLESQPTRIEYGPQSLDGSLGSITWWTRLDPEPLTLHWCRPRPQTITGRISGPGSLRILLELYQPFAQSPGQSKNPITAAFLAGSDHRSLLGEEISTGKSVTARRRFLLRTDRPASGAAAYRDQVTSWRRLISTGQASAVEGEDNTIAYRQAALSYDLAEKSSITFAGTVGEQWESIEQQSREILGQPFDQQITAAEKSWRTRRPTGRGEIGEKFERIVQYLTLNRLFDPRRGSRYFAQTGVDSPPQPPGSDSFLLALAGAVIDPLTAAATIRRILDSQLTDGRIPPGIAADGSLASGRSMAPIGAFSTLKVYLATGNLELLTTAWPQLRLWNEWWFNNRGDGQAWRDGNMDGLLEWGFNEELELGSLGRRQLTPLSRRRLAWREAEGILSTSELTGISAELNGETGTIEQNSIILNSLYALDTECLALIARELGLNAEADLLQRRYEALRILINQKLWDEDSGSYVDRHWKGQAAPLSGLQQFLPLIAGIPDPDRVERMMAKWPGLTSGEMLQSSSTWMKYLVYTGLRRHDRHREATMIAGQVSTSPEVLASWPAIEELYCTDPFSGLNFGHLGPASESRIERLPTPQGLLDLTLGPQRTTISRDGLIEIDGEAALRFRGYQRRERTISTVILSDREVRLFVPGERGRKITVSVDNKIIGSTSSGAAASFPVPSGSHRVLVVR